MMEGQIPEDVKDTRLQRLQALLRSQQDAFNQACVGRVLPVLLERLGRHPGQLGGRSPYLQAVHVAGPAEWIGRIVPVRMESCGPNSLAGTVSRGDTSAARVPA
jgi:tRNA-2-methylthio-N6-dimethylallyladenosine synthase